MLLGQLLQFLPDDGPGRQPHRKTGTGKRVGSEDVHVDIEIPVVGDHSVCSLWLAGTDGETTKPRNTVPGLEMSEGDQSITKAPEVTGVVVEMRCPCIAQKSTCCASFRARRVRR